MLKKYVAVSSTELALLLCSAVPEGTTDIPEGGLKYHKLDTGAYIPKGKFGFDPGNAAWLQKAKTMPASGLLGRAISGKASLLEWFMDRGYTFLPLDAITLGFLVGLNLPYELVADWLSVEEFYGVERMAGEALREWEKTWTKGDFGWAVNWLRHDSHTLFAPFVTVHLAAALVAPLREKASRLVVFRAPYSMFLSLTECSDIGPCIWQDALPERTVTIRYNNDPARLPEADIVRPDESYAKLAGAAVFSGVDWFRYRVPAEAMAANKAYPSGILHTILAYERNPLCYTSRDDVFGLPLEAFLLTFRLCEDEAGVQALQGSARGILPYTDSLGHIFRTVVWNRFATFDRGYRRLRDIWTKYPPAFCIGENIAAGERCLGLLVASELGIPTIGLPHSTFTVDKPATITVPCEIVGHNSEFVAAYHRKELGDSVRVMSFSDTSIENSLVTNPGEGFFPKDSGVRVLVLPEVVMLPRDALGFYMYPEIQRRWVRALQSVPPDLCDAVTIRYKMHPAFHGTLSFFSSVEGFDSGALIDAKAALLAVLQETDILVCLEYTSSPLILGMRSNVPVVSCSSPEGQLSPNRSAVCLAAAKAGIFVASPADLWSVLRSLMTDPKARQQVCTRQMDFLQNQYLVARDGKLADHIASRIFSADRKA